MNRYPSSTLESKKTACAYPHGLYDGHYYALVKNNFLIILSIVDSVIRHPHSHFLLQLAVRPLVVLLESLTNPVREGF
jgi:hypothetical protein